MASLDELKSDVIALAQKITTDTFSADDILSLYKKEKSTDLPFEKHAFKTAIDFLASLPFFAKTSTTKGIRFLCLKVEAPLFAEKRPVKREGVDSYEAKPPAKKVKKEPPEPPESPEKTAECQPAVANTHGPISPSPVLADATGAAQVYPVPRELSFACLVLFNTFEAILDLLDVCGGQATRYQIDHKSVEIQGCPICIVISWDVIANECHRSPNPIEKVCDSPLTLRNPNFGKRTAAALEFKNALLREDDLRLMSARDKIAKFLAAVPVSMDLLSDMYKQRYGVPLSSKVEQRRLTGAENTEMFLSRLMGRNFEESKIVYSLLPTGKYILKIVKTDEQRRFHRILLPPGILSDPPRPLAFLRRSQHTLPSPALIPNSSASVLSPSATGSPWSPLPPPPPPLLPVAPVSSPIPEATAAPSAILPAAANPLVEGPQPDPGTSAAPSLLDSIRESALPTALSKWKKPSRLKLTDIFNLKVVARTIEVLAHIGSKKSDTHNIQKLFHDIYSRSMKNLAKRLKGYIKMPQSDFPFHITYNGKTVTDMNFGQKSLAQDAYVEALDAEYNQRLAKVRANILEILPENGEMPLVTLASEYRRRFGIANFEKKSFHKLTQCHSDEEFCIRIEGFAGRNAPIVYGKTKAPGGAVWHLKRGKRASSAKGSPEKEQPKEKEATEKTSSSRASGNAKENRPKSVDSIPLPTVAPRNPDDAVVSDFIEKMQRVEDTSMENLVLILTVARFVDLINRNGGTATLNEMQKLHKAVYGRPISVEAFLRWKAYRNIAGRYPFKIQISGQPPTLRNLQFGRKYPSLDAYLDKVRHEFDKKMELARRRILVLLNKFGPMNMETMASRYGLTFSGVIMKTNQLFELAHVDKEEEFCRRIEGDDIYAAKAIYYVENGKMFLACANPGLVARVFSESGIDEATRRRFCRAAVRRADKKTNASTTKNAEVIDILSDGEEAPMPSKTSGVPITQDPSDAPRSDAVPCPASSWSPATNGSSNSARTDAARLFEGPSSWSPEKSAETSSPTENTVAPAASDASTTVPVVENPAIVSGPTTAVASSSNMEIDNDDMYVDITAERASDTGVSVTSPGPIPDGEEEACARQIRLDSQFFGENLVVTVVTPETTSNVVVGTEKGAEEEAPVESPTEDVNSIRSPPMDSSLEDGEVRSEPSAVSEEAAFPSTAPEVSALPEAAAVPDEPPAMEFEGEDDVVSSEVHATSVTSEAPEAPESPVTPASPVVSDIDSADVVTASEGIAMDSESCGSLIFVDASSTFIPGSPTANPVSHDVRVGDDDVCQKTFESDVPPAASSSPIKAKTDDSFLNTTAKSECGANEEKFKLASNMVLMALRDADRRGEDTDAIIHRMFTALYQK